MYLGYYNHELEYNKIDRINIFSKIFRKQSFKIKTFLL